MKTAYRLITCVWLGLLLAAPGSSAKELPRTKPESVGMSSERLARINEVMSRHIEKGDIQGAVTAVVGITCLMAWWMYWTVWILITKVLRAPR